MLTGDPVLRPWWEMILVQRLEGLYIRTLREMGYHRLDKASGSEVDMTLVAGTVGNIDPNAPCDDEGCAQQGEAYKDHRVAHTTRGVRKGQRGECPHCHGKLHNVHDSAQLIAFQCLWKQTFGEQYKRVQVGAMTLEAVVDKLNKGEIKAFADRALLHTVTLAPAVTLIGTTTLPKAAAQSTGSAGSVATPSPAIPAPAAPRSAPATPPTPATNTGPTTSSVPATALEKAERKRKLQDALKDAKVMP